MKEVVRKGGEVQVGKTVGVVMKTRRENGGLRNRGT
jgi:hypothetical protein